MKKYLGLLLLLAFLAGTVTSPAIAQEVAQDPAALAECNVNVAPAVGTVCLIQGVAYEFKGEFSATQLGFNPLDTVGHLSLNTMETLVSMTAWDNMSFMLNTLAVGTGNEFSDPSKHIYGVWILIAPNSEAFWNQVLDSMK